MKSATLIINPVAGRCTSGDLAQRMTSVLLRKRFQTTTVFTSALVGSARSLAWEASQNSDLIIACGGDGTVHGALQGVAQSSAALGVVPLGTANALARNLQLPLDPVSALEKLLTYHPTEIPLGCATTASGSRWFAVMAGAGPDGALAREVTAADKARLGRAAYYTCAARLYMTHTFPAFAVAYRLAGSTIWYNLPAAAMMASRVPDLGGLFSGLTKASRLHDPHLLVQLLATPTRIALPAWMTLSRIGLGKLNPWLTHLEVEEIRCTPLAEGDVVDAQADGEPIGCLPLVLKIVQSGVRLMMP